MFPEANKVIILWTKNIMKEKNYFSDLQTGVWNA